MTVLIIGVITYIVNNKWKIVTTVPHKNRMNLKEEVSYEVSTIV